MLKAPTVGKIKSKAVFCQISHFMTCWSNTEGEPSHKNTQTPIFHISSHIPTLRCGWTRVGGQVEGGADAHTSTMAALGFHSTHSQDIHTSFRVPVHLPTALLLGLQPAGKLRGWHPSGRGAGQSQQKLPSPLSPPGLVQRLGLVCEVCSGQTPLWPQEPGTTKHKC